MSDPRTRMVRLGVITAGVVVVVLSGALAAASARLPRFARSRSTGGACGHRPAAAPVRPLEALDPVLVVPERGEVAAAVRH